jgi:general secretion pathway protein J
VKAAPQAGFALIEALASLVLVGLISLMLIDGVGAGTRVWERLDARAAGGESVEAAQSLLRDRIERMYPADRYDAPRAYVDFAGSAGRLSFLAPPPQAVGPAPLRRFQLGLTDSGDLVLDADPQIGPDGPRTQIVLLRGVRALAISYFGAALADPQRRWRADWSHRAQPPEAVRLRLAFAPGDRRQWPDLVVRPGASVGADCSYSASGGGCRDAE